MKDKEKTSSSYPSLATVSKQRYVVSVSDASKPNPETKFRKLFRKLSFKAENDDFWRKMINFDAKLTILNIFSENNKNFLVILVKNHNGKPF